MVEGAGADLRPGTLSEIVAGSHLPLPRVPAFFAGARAVLERRDA
jgi:hypothetical protein